MDLGENRVLSIRKFLLFNKFLSKKQILAHCYQTVFRAFVALLFYYSLCAKLLSRHFKTFPGEPDGQHRAGRLSHHLLCRASKEDMIQACPPMCSHHDEIYRFLLGHLDDLYEGLTLFEQNFIIFEFLQLSEVMGVQFLLKFFLLGGPQFFQFFLREVNRKLFGVVWLWSDMEDKEFGFVGFSEVKGIGEGPVRVFRKIGTEQNLFKRRLFPPYFLIFKGISFQQIAC